jgi:DNA uptake protein ComE-like DNA-binding protein
VPSHFLLRRNDQAALAVLMAVAWIALAVYVIANGGFAGGLVEADAAPPQSMAFGIDVNAAAWPELTLLPDIGIVRAQNIVQAREAGGRFRSLDDLERRAVGIGRILAARMRPYVLPMNGGDRPHREGLAQK